MVLSFFKLFCYKIKFIYEKMKEILETKLFILIFILTLN